MFVVTRTGICKAWLIEPSSPSEERVKASATAGGITGGVGGAILSKSTCFCRCDGMKVSIDPSVEDSLSCRHLISLLTLHRDPSCNHPSCAHIYAFRLCGTKRVQLLGCTTNVSKTSRCRGRPARKQIIVAADCTEQVQPNESTL